MCHSVAVLAMLRREEASHTSSVVQDKRLRLRGLLELFKDLPSITQARNEDNSWQFHSFAEGSVLLDGLEASGVQKHHRHGSKPVQVLTACAKVTMQFKHVQANSPCHMLRGPGKNSGNWVGLTVWRAWAHTGKCFPLAFYIAFRDYPIR